MQCDVEMASVLEVVRAAGLSERYKGSTFVGTPIEIIHYPVLYPKINFNSILTSTSTLKESL